VLDALARALRLDEAEHAHEFAARLHVDFGGLEPRMRNMPRLVFLDEASRHLYPEWEQVGRETVAYLRFEASAHPDDVELHALVGELSTVSAEFRRWWARHDVREKSHGLKRYRHPLVGELELHYETLALPGDDRQTLVTYTADTGSPSETALRMLAVQ